MIEHPDHAPAPLRRCACGVTSGSTGRLIGGAGLLACTGLVTLYSAGNENIHLVINQALRFALGGLLLLLVSRIPPRELRTWTPWLYASRCCCW